VVSKKYLRSKFGRKFLGLFFLAFLLLFPGVSFVPEKLANAQETIRVLILRDAPMVKIAGQDLIVRDFKTGLSLFHKKGFSSLTASGGASVIVRAGDHSVSAQALTVNSPSAPLHLDGKIFRGQLILFSGPNQDVWAVNELPIEEYVVGLINYEISSQWMMEAVKAQAVAARTYAVFQKAKRAGELYHLDSSVNDQMYGGIQREDARSRTAVKQTEREILVYQGKPIFAVYSACCGGKTASPNPLWEGSFPYLQSRECNFCLASPHFFWKWEVPAEDLAKRLAAGGFPETRVREIEIRERSPGQRVLQLAVRGDQSRLLFSGKDFRRLLGFDLLRSTRFVVKKENGIFSFLGRGWGHGVGLCQWGAKGMAEAGADYRSILKYYYRGIELRKIAK
jgi:stage II sporulation protein D